MLQSGIDGFVTEGMDNVPGGANTQQDKGTGVLEEKWLQFRLVKCVVYVVIFSVQLGLVYEPKLSRIWRYKTVNSRAVLPSEKVWKNIHCSFSWLKT